jgi:cardiolipin synthase
VLAVLGAKRIDVTWFGKAGTLFLMFAFPLFLLGNSTAGVADAAEVAAWLCAVPGLAFGYYALAQYVPLGLEALRDGREGRRKAIPEVPA